MVCLLEARGSLGKIMVKGNQSELYSLLKDIETTQANGMLELHASSKNYALDVRGIVIKGMFVVMSAFTAYQVFYGEAAAKLLRLFTLEEREAQFWAEFNKLRHEELIHELEAMDAESLLDMPIRPTEIILL